MQPRKLLLRAAVLTAFAFVVLPVAPAAAGRLLLTGHDADLHCSGGSQCHFVRIAVQHVRAGAPDPAKPVLVLDRDDLDMVAALDGAFGPGVVPRVVRDPRSPAFAAEPLTTAKYSAILVASDTTCGGCDLNEPIVGGSETPDSDAINRRKADIASFFNSGGGLYVNSGADHGDGDATNGPDTYYQFIPAAVGGKVVSPPFCLTSVGIALGLQDATTSCPDASKRLGTNDDINCCATHNSFQNPPAGSALQVAERDLGADGVISGDDAPETLVASGVIIGGVIAADGDGDGVPDATDACPDQRGPAPRGCPAVTLGKTFNAELVKGVVFVSVPAAKAGASQNQTVPGLKGRTFVPLAKARTLPVGSFIDTRKGAVRLRSARNRAGRLQSGIFAAGVFQVAQSRKRRARGLTSLTLKGSSFRRCSRGGSSGADALASQRRSKRTIRRLRANTRGRFRTRGRYSSATVRGTKWLTSDRCDGTLTKVTRGKVAVRDLRRKKTILLRKGKRYLARRR